MKLSTTPMLQLRESEDLNYLFDETSAVTDVSYRNAKATALFLKGWH
jgi:hypothetical protein